MAVPLRGEGGLPLSKKHFLGAGIFLLFVEKIPTAIKLEGGIRGG